MTPNFDAQIRAALGTDLPAFEGLTVTGEGELPACFAVSDLALSTICAAMGEVAALTGAGRAVVDRRLALKWFDMTLKPDAWQLPSAWDAIAGDYEAADGWIRLHTNAPHHRDAALSVLGTPAEREQVAARVATWAKDALERAIVEAGGAAAAMHSLDTWQRHPQGQAVAAEPLIAWEATGVAPRDTRLKGLRVLDLTRVLAGPVATRFLSGFGADVLRIDPAWWSEPGVEPEVTLGKRRAGLDLTAQEDRATFRHLLSKADVLVHGYRAGALEALGFGPEARQAIAPGLIDVSLNAYGWTGPWAGRRGFDSLVQMSSGIACEGMRLTAGDRPRPLPVQALDHGTGYLMAAAVLRALRRRQTTGKAWSARLSLARVAGVLTQAGARDLSGAALGDLVSDWSESVEQTDWGPARRVIFPGTLDGAGPSWPRAAGRLRVDPAAW